MNRVERFRTLRQVRRRYALAIFLCFLLFISGICIADYSVNSLMKNESSIGFITFNNRESCIEFSILNHRLYLNTYYMNKDIKKVKKVISALISF